MKREVIQRCFKKSFIPQHKRESGETKEREEETDDVFRKVNAFETTGAKKKQEN